MLSSSLLCTPPRAFAPATLLPSQPRRLPLTPLFKAPSPSNNPAVANFLPSSSPICNQLVSVFIYLFSVPTCVSGVLFTGEEIWTKLVNETSQVPSHACSAPK